MILRMSDELVVAAKAASELEPAVRDFAEATGLLGPVREMVEWVTQSIRYRREPSKAKLLVTSAAKIRASGLPVRAVDDRLLRAVLEDGALEDDPEMQERWANLLAGAATGSTVAPAYPEILRQLEPVESRLLDELVDEHGMTRSMPPGYPVHSVPEFEPRHFGNLERLGLVAWEVRGSGSGGTYTLGELESLPRVPPQRWLTSTALGAAFVTACRSPETSAG